MKYEVGNEEVRSRRRQMERYTYREVRNTAMGEGDNSSRKCQ